ncbi:MAG: universal stress protein, partial [Candidatus Eremiobacterota bacterium]
MNVLLAVEDSAAVGLAEDLLQSLSLPEPSYVAVVAASGGPSSAEVRKQLKEIAQRQRRVGVEASTLTLTGDPFKSILKLAADLPADLVVVGVGDRPEATAGLSARLVQSCQCPVGIARNGRPVRRVLLAFNNPETPSRCLDFLSQFPWPPDGPEVVYHPLVVIPERREAEETRARALLADVEKRLKDWNVR